MAKDFIYHYKYSSFPDYFADGQKGAEILNKRALPIDIGSILGMDAILESFAQTEQRYGFSSSAQKFLS